VKVLPYAFQVRAGSRVKARSAIKALNASTREVEDASASGLSP
jgi:hypothetical protein